MSRHMSYIIKDTIERIGYQIIAKNHAYLIKSNECHIETFIQQET
jgi:hypothetical protein